MILDKQEGHVPLPCFVPRRLVHGGRVRAPDLTEEIKQYNRPGHVAL